MIQDKILLPSKKYKLSTEEDTQLGISLDSKNRLFKENDIIDILNLDDQFKKERQESSIYRIYGKISLVTYDEETKTSNINTFSPFEKEEVINNIKTLSNVDINLLDKNNWEIQILYPYSSDSQSPFYDEVVFKDNFNSNKGWTFSPDDTQEVQIIDGALKVTPDLTIWFVGAKKGDIFKIGKEYEITYEIKNLEGNASAQVLCGQEDGTIRTSDGTYTEILTALNNTELAFVFPVGIGNNLQIDNIIIKKRNPSKTKHRRLFKVLTTTNDYDLIKSGFETNPYGDEVIQFIFNKDIDISNLSDYLGRPISELYLSIVKKLGPEITDLEEGFNRVYNEPTIDFVKSDYYIGDEVVVDSVNLTQETISTRFHKFSQPGGDIIYTNNFNNSASTGFFNLFITQGVLRFIGSGPPSLVFTSLFNNLVVGLQYKITYEIKNYNSGTNGQANVKCGQTLGQVITSNGVFTDILTCQGSPALVFQFYGGDQTFIEVEYIEVTMPDINSYYYKPFYKIEARRFSNSILDGNTETTLGIPSYATVVDNDGNRIWKNLIPIGDIEDETNVIDYPFVNNKHYLYDNYKLFVRRVIPLHELSQFDLKPVDDTTIEVFSTFGGEDTRIPLSPGEECVVKEDRKIIEPGTSGPGTSAKEKQDKEEDDFNDPC